MHPVLTLLTEKRMKLSSLMEQLRDRESALAVREATYSSILGSIEVDKKSVEVVKVITEKMSANGVAHIQGMVTQGLQTIFHDDTYRFEMEVLERGTAKTVEFYIVDSRGVRTSLDKCGGGLIVVSSFLLRIYLIIKLKLMRFIVLDEAFIQVSAEYTEGLMTFLHMLVKEAGFRFLWVSHSQNYIDGADHIYKISHGSVTKVETYKAH
jgi:DNA repair exonuclease SbcCD ATPase subunit